MALDANSTVWTFKTWGGPVRLVSPSLDCSSPETTPVQAECGQWFCAVLTRSGDAYAWWVDAGTFKDLYLETRRISVGPVIEHEGVVLCRTQEFKMDPNKLPTLPDLPDLPGTGLPEEERKKETRLIKIAAGSHCLIGLTNKGHVLKLDGMRNEDDTRIWHYVSEAVRVRCILSSCGAQLPYHSEIDKIKKIPAFRPTTGGGDQERPPRVELSSDTLLITHVSNVAPID